MEIIPNQWKTIEATVNKDHSSLVLFNGKKSPMDTMLGALPDISDSSWRIPRMFVTRTGSSDMRLALSKHVLHRNGATPERI